MNRLALALFALCVGTCIAQDAATSSSLKRLYIEEHTITKSGASAHCDAFGNCFAAGRTKTKDISLEVTREVIRQCPEALVVTNNRDVADFDLRISAGSSTLYLKNGDAAYISPTKYRVSNLAKDVCAYVRGTATHIVVAGSQENLKP